MRFLIAYDGSNVGKKTLEHACSYAKVFGADMVVVASVEGGSLTHEIEIKNAKENLEYAEGIMKNEGIAVETNLLVRGFSPGQDIVKFANENDFQAMFIGIRQRSKVDKLLFGSNAQYIILRAPCPVIQ